MSRRTTLDQVFDLIREYPGRPHYGGPGADLIPAAEEALGLTFPPSYRRFVSEFGAGGIGAVEIFGITGPEFENSAVPNGVWLTLDERTTSNLPSTMIVVTDDGMGGYFVLDTAKADKDGEPPVEVWRMGMSEPGDRLEVVYPNFTAMLKELVEDELDLHPEARR